jgi:hypothetical protein
MGLGHHELDPDAFVSDDRECDKMEQASIEYRDEEHLPVHEMWSKVHDRQCNTKMHGI